MDGLRREPALIRGAIEEILRYEGPIQGSGRVAVEDLELYGEKVGAGHAWVWTPRVWRKERSARSSCVACTITAKSRCRGGIG